MAEHNRLNLRQLFAEHGTRHQIEGNTPILVTGHDSLWYIDTGSIDVFAVTLQQENDPARDKRRYLFSMSEGAILFGFRDHSSEERSGILLAATAGTAAYHIDTESFMQLQARHGLDSAQLAPLVEQWINSWSTALSTRNAPSEFDILEQAELQELKPDTTWRTLHPVWVKLHAGSVHWMGEHPLQGGGEVYIPVTSSSWLETKEPCSIEVRSTVCWLQADAHWQSLYAFHDMAAARLAALRTKERLLEHERLINRTEHDSTLMDKALKQLVAVTGGNRQKPLIFDSKDPLFMACRIAGEYSDIVIKPSVRGRKGTQSLNPLHDIAQASGVRSRKVVLKGEWWKEDNGPLVAYLEESSEPIALVPSSSASYTWTNPASGEGGAVTAEVASKLHPMAYMFYRAFPSKPLGVIDILRFGSHKSVRRDIAVLLFMGAIAGLLGMLIPIATGMMFDTVIPESYRGPLVQMALILFSVTLAIALFQLTGSMASLRMEGRMDSFIQAAIWDRLLNLPVAFFRNYTAGDLAIRANSINAIRQLLSGAVLGSLFSGLFSIFNYALLFHYDAGLALAAGVLVLISIAVTAAIGLLQIRFQRKLLDIQGRISGLMLQLLNGVSKFRMAAAENRAFFLWARAFAEQKKLSFRARMLDNQLGVFQSFYPLVASMVLFYMVASKESSLSAGQFIAFYTAFSAFLAAMLSMASALLSLVHVVPLYERAKPILQTLPEVHDQLEDPGDLSGAIEVRHIGFRYGADQPMVLKDISLNIKAGQFVAFVGASGCGKSTLLRLLLGFEQPESGSVYFDGQDMRSLDVSLLRSQFGVVLQNSKLMSGDMYTNIVGSSNLTVDEAWEAAAMAGLDEDIRNMPMGMHSVISEGGSTLSGGQRQRLMIARAIARRPKVIFFDEATSALDNRTQAIVSESLERLQATRIVIAHRLSTITNADLIYVLDKGMVVQSGTYEELMAETGLFAELASRQLA
ncbi:NHLP bacteriocin export ABC transporter permease/ATPase subunit [Paenibacillus oenotherae]|uniref:NHLP bacteriocin export ABC transporter permease/ATPase subunit n=1 Tax=Paenibacillus oenotherae TaxID=1435645 RepID=A0ABS7D2G8_9BACL|nr:NHLP bacteriocin export ABC transporter permease/ATPase subunit [Paenibacillus oenotherae]MBW7474046.1 NHLP bacteriocin export ABC transporter permease/ATPase subunit [Paenibacillus oenotherae]